MLQAELVPRIHPFTANAALTAVLLTCTLGSASDPAPVSCLLAVQSAMTGFHPDSFRCFGTVLCAQLRSSGFPFLLRRSLPCGMLRLLYIGWHIINTNPKSCVFSSVTIHDISLFCKSLCSFFFYPTICKSPPGDRGGPFAAAIHQSIQSSAQPCSSAERRGFAAEAEGAGAGR